VQIGARHGEVLPLTERTGRRQQARDGAGQVPEQTVALAEALLQMGHGLDAHGLQRAVEEHRAVEARGVVAHLGDDVGVAEHGQRRIGVGTSWRSRRDGRTPWTRTVAASCSAGIGDQPGLIDGGGVDLATVVTWSAFALALVAFASYALGPGFGSSQTLNLFAIPMPFGIGDFAIGVYVNAVTVIMLTLVSLVGAIVTTYARTYMAGDAGEGHFHKWLLLTLAAILTLIVSSNLLMFALAWMATSLNLHRLLLFYPDRRAAQMAAHKKFVFSRIGDASLFLAVLLIGASGHTLDFETLFARWRTWTGPLPWGCRPPPG
jgi:hypothetical protein